MVASLIRPRGRTRTNPAGPGGNVPAVPAVIRGRSRFVEVSPGLNPDHPPTPGGGRPSKFTPEAERIILEKISKGTPLIHAAHCAGVSYDTLNRWRNLGLAEFKAGNDTHPLARFCAALQKAEGAFVSTRVDAIVKDDSWQASAWLLERRFPEQFAKQDKLTLAGRLDTVGVNFNVDAMRDDIPDVSLVGILTRLGPRLGSGPVAIEAPAD